LRARFPLVSGKFAVLGDWGTSPNYDRYLAKLDGSPAVRLGSGVGGGISPDDKWVTSILPSDTSRVLLLPTGPGEAKTVTAPNFEHRSAEWTSDGRRLVVRASESGRPVRFWIQDLVGGSPHAITQEGMAGRFVTVNHSDYISSRDSDGIHRLYPIDGGEPKAVKGMVDSDEVTGGAPESESLYVTPNDSNPPLRPILKVNIATGLRQPLVTVSPTDPAGIVGVSPPLFTVNQTRYVYEQARELSVLYVASGIK